MAPYPTTDQIEDIFASRARPDKFNSYFDSDVDVHIPGVDFNVGAKHQGLQAFHEGTWGKVVSSTLKEETFRVDIKRVIGGGDSAWAAIEYTHTAEGKNGHPYENSGVFLARFNLEGKIVQLKQYADTRHIHGHVEGKK